MSDGTDRADAPHEHEFFQDTYAPCRVGDCMVTPVDYMASLRARVAKQDQELATERARRERAEAALVKESGRWNEGYVAALKAEGVATSGETPARPLSQNPTETP